MTAADPGANTNNETEKSTVPSRIQLCEGDVTVEKLQQCFSDQDVYINYLEDKIEALNKARDERNKAEGSRREQLLVMRLTAKEQEIQELTSQLAETKAAHSPTSALLRSTLLDPAVNLVIDKLTKQCDNLKKEVEEKEQELAAWKFTPDSASGKRLMARCRQLHQENEDLGKMIASGKLSKLESELALQKNLAEKFKQNELEMDDFIAELDEDAEGLQSTIVVLQQQLKEAKDEITKLNSELGKDTERRSSLEVDKDSLRTETSDNTEENNKRKSQDEEANDEIESEHDSKKNKTSEAE